VGAALVIAAVGLGTFASRTASATTSAQAPVVTVLSPQQVVPGVTPSFHWPSRGEAAVAVSGISLVGASPHERRVPIASLTKMMTALVVLHDHPLRPGRAGPSVAFAESDVEDWRRELQAGDSVVEVRAGETMTEFQLLEALLIPSGDNIADRLASWDAGSSDAFVARMNRMARAVGLVSTKYADPSGVDPRSASTAADQALVASLLMANPVARDIVRRQRIDLPVVGIVANLNPALGFAGIIGVKGGFTSQAHRCLVTAAYRSHHAAIVLSVALGQPEDKAAARIDETLLEAVSPLLRRAPLAVPGAEIGVLTMQPSGWSIGLVAPRRPPTAIVWPGLALTYAISTGSTAATGRMRPGSVVGVLTVTAPFGTLSTMPVGVAATRPTLPAPPDERPRYG
jgi:serine-type D-Ala-D-Ala carboxypeptidase (penicillin-binding protein 5/6)